MRRTALFVVRRLARKSEAAGKVRAAEWRSFQQNPQLTHAGRFTSAFEEYRYDALGRRVVVLARRSCNDEDDASRRLECDQDHIRRTVWMQDQELYEIQMPADSTTAQATVENDDEPVHVALTPDITNQNPYYGRVAYTYGLGIDQPLAVTRINYVGTRLNDSTSLVNQFTLVPLWNSRGEASDAYLAEAPSGVTFCTQFDLNPCLKAELPAVWAAFFPEERVGYPVTWTGTILTGKRDETGTLYRRNRSYDPKSGRFTQKDPIGLAGGINLYGYAGGDPVNFSDPFGLCPEWVDGKPCNLNAAASFAAGFGDAVTFGATDWVRDKMGTNDVVDKDGAAYFGGQVGAVVAGAGVGAAAAGASEASTGKVVIGETMTRVRAAAATHGAETFETGAAPQRRSGKRTVRGFVGRCGMARKLLISARM